MHMAKILFIIKIVKMLIVSRYVLQKCLSLHAIKFNASLCHLLQIR